MRIPKRYGQSKVLNCFYCGKLAVAETKEGIPSCNKHKNRDLPELKCACGSWLEPRKGKWGTYFHCLHCGNVNYKRALEMNEHVKEKKKPAETTINSDDIGISY